MATLLDMLDGHPAEPEVKPPVPPGFWKLSRDGNPEAFAIFRRHYSAKHNPNPKQRQFVGPGERMVLLGREPEALFVWRKEKYRRDKQPGVNCAVFRNESRCRSSDMIRDAASLAWNRWPRERLFTFVNPGEVASRNPGYCFLMAGWRRCGVTRGGLIVLEILPDPGS
jgi:hypothetical protein